VLVVPVTQPCQLYGQVNPVSCTGDSTLLYGCFDPVPCMAGLEVYPFVYSGCIKMTHGFVTINRSVIIVHYSCHFTSIVQKSNSHCAKIVHKLAYSIKIYKNSQVPSY